VLIGDVEVVAVAEGRGDQPTGYRFKP